MSATKDFYFECAENGVYPVDETRSTIPAWAKRRSFEATARDGSTFLVTGISVSDACSLWNSGWREQDIGFFLSCFCGFSQCPHCGRVGHGHFFVGQSCVDCA